MLGLHSLTEVKTKKFLCEAVWFPQESLKEEQKNTQEL